MAETMSQHSAPRVMIIAGEASGDLHAAKLVRAVHTHMPAVQFFGIGGSDMRAAGVEVRVDSSDLAIVGLVEVLFHYRRLKAILEEMRTLLRTERPDLLILTDYPDFNLRLAKTAKEIGVPVLYYISPQIWAWRQGRIKSIRERVDMMAVIFPFEETLYREHNVPVRFVGHPLVDEVSTGNDRDALLHEFGLDPQRKIVGLFPGSRRGEIKRLLPILLKTATLLRENNPGVQFLLPRASTISEQDLAPYLGEHSKGNNPLDIRIISGRNRDIMRACDVIVAASGTVTLEIALTGTPMIIIYKVALLTYLIIGRMLKIDHIGLCNIVANDRIVPELIQHQARPAHITAEVQRLLDDPAQAQTMRDRLATIRARLGTVDNDQGIGMLVVEMLKTASETGCLKDKKEKS